MLDDPVQTNSYTNVSATKWWFERRAELEILARERAPLYVYNDETLNDTFFDFLWIDAVDSLFYTVAANPHLRILEKAYQLGVGLLCSSSVELEHVLRVFPEVGSQKLIFAPIFAGPEEYDYAFRQGAIVLLNNILLLKTCPDVFRGKDIFICVARENPHQSHNSIKNEPSPLKCGIAPSEIDTLVQIIKSLSITVRGLHAQLRAPFLVSHDLSETASFLAGLIEHFPGASIFSLGNGIGISIKPGLEILDFQATKNKLEAIKDMYPKFTFWLEPGDCIVSHAGALLTKVTETHQMEGNYYVRINEGMELLLRSPQYGPQHEVVNFSKLGEKATRLTHIMGLDDDPNHTICCVKHLAPVDEGDILLITNTGARVPGQRLGSNKAAHQHFLCARKMCSVKI